LLWCQFGQNPGVRLGVIAFCRLFFLFLCWHSVDCGDNKNTHWIVIGDYIDTISLQTTLVNINEM
jgi:hypothetical protein